MIAIFDAEYATAQHIVIKAQFQKELKKLNFQDQEACVKLGNEERSVRF